MYKLPKSNVHIRIFDGILSIANLLHLENKLTWLAKNKMVRIRNLFFLSEQNRKMKLLLRRRRSAIQVRASLQNSLLLEAISLGRVCMCEFALVSRKYHAYNEGNASL